MWTRGTTPLGTTSKDNKFFSESCNTNILVKYGVYDRMLNFFAVYRFDLSSERWRKPEITDV